MGLGPSGARDVDRGWLATIPFFFLPASRDRSVLSPNAPQAPQPLRTASAASLVLTGELNALCLSLRRMQKIKTIKKVKRMDIVFMAD